MGAALWLGLKFFDKALAGSFEAQLSAVTALVVGGLLSFVLLAWLFSVVSRCGLNNLLRHRIRRVTFVMHNVMAADDVKQAEELSARNRIATDPHLRAVQERLAACSYKMAHPDSGRLVPACVQHAIFDEVINRRSIAELNIRKKQSRVKSHAT